MPVRDSPRACASSEKKKSWRLAARPRLAREPKRLLINPTRSCSITFLHSSTVQSRLPSRHVFASARMVRRDARWPLVATKFSNRRPPVMPAIATTACLGKFSLVLADLWCPQLRLCTAPAFRQCSICLGGFEWPPPRSPVRPRLQKHRFSGPCQKLQQGTQCISLKADNNRVIDLVITALILIEA